MSVVDDLGRKAQRRLGAALRSRVAGDDAAERAVVIWGREGERRFGPEDPVWRVHADASMFPGGVCALLLQSLHPSAMAGVAGHSGYRSDPWGRLQRTSHFLATTTFGTVEDSDAAVARVRGIHERVRGRDGDGVPYRASDPDLLGWVHVAEAWSFLGAFQRYSATPLTPEEADAYVRQSAVVAEQLGARSVPIDASASATCIPRSAASWPQAQAGPRKGGLASRQAASNASTSESVWMMSKSTMLSTSPTFLCSSLVDARKYDPTRSRREADLPM